MDEKTQTPKDKQKKYYDKKEKVVELSIGDQVLVRQKAFDGKPKIEDRFETDMYMIVDKPRRDMPVYRVRSGEKERILHRNLLVLVENQDRDSEEDRDESEYDEEVNGIILGNNNKQQEEKGDVAVEEETDSDDGDEFVGNSFLGGDAHNHIATEETEKMMMMKMMMM